MLRNDRVFKQQYVLEIVAADVVHNQTKYPKENNEIKMIQNRGAASQRARVVGYTVISTAMLRPRRK